MNQVISRAVEEAFLPPITGWLLVCKIMLILITLFFVGFMIYVCVTTTWLKRLILWDLREFWTWKPYTIRKIDKDWARILKRLETGLETEYKMAVIDADLLLNDVMTRMGHEGKTLGEKLEKIKPGILSSVRNVSAADQVCQNILYDQSYQLSHELAKKAIAAFEKALTDLQAF